MFMQFIVHIHLFSHDMKVRHRPVLDSCRRQSERLVCAVPQYLSFIATVPASRKKNDAGSDLLQCFRQRQNKLSIVLQPCVCARIKTHAPLLFCCLVGKKNDSHKNAMCVPTQSLLSCHQRKLYHLFLNCCSTSDFINYFLVLYNN